MSSVTFDPARAQVDAAYQKEVINLYNQGRLDFSNKNDEKIFKGILANSKDDNQYQIEDDALQTDNKNTKSNAPSTGKKVNAAADLAVSAGTFAAGEIVKKAAVGKAMEKFGEEGAKSILDEKGTKILARDNSIGQTLECIVAFAVGTKYMLSRPNKAEHHELNNLKEVMETGNLELVNGQEEIEESNNNIEDTKTEIDDTEKTSEEDIEDIQKELEEKQARLSELEQKVQSGEELTEAEQSEYETLGGENGEIAALEGKISEIKAGESEVIESKQEDIEAEQETVEEVDDIFHSVTEVADYAETFDTATQTLSVVEAVAQGANAVMGFKAAAELTQKHPMLSLTTFGQIARGMALAGAGMSTFGAIEQTKYAVDIGKEISVREDVQKTGAVVEEEIESGTENIEQTVENTTETLENLKEGDGENLESSIKEELPITAQTAPEPDSADGADDDKKEDDIKEPSEI